MSTNARFIHKAIPLFGDFQVRDIHVSYARTITESHLVHFTAFAGMQMPIFIDHEYARNVGIFKSPIVPGFLTASISGGMLESVLGTNIIAGLGMDSFLFKTPVHPGDTLHAEVEIVGKEENSDSGAGVLSVRVSVINQRNETALSYLAKVLMKR